MDILFVWRYLVIVGSYFEFVSPFCTGLLSVWMIGLLSIVKPDEVMICVAEAIAL